MMTPYVSVFDEVFDVVVYGSGYAAVAATWAVAQEGKRVLLLGARFDLLWESGRAFATKAGSLDDPLWQSFLDELAAQNRYRDGLIDCAGAEIAACARFRNAGQGVRILLQAPVIGMRREGAVFTSVNVATKAGERTVRARQWIDASEEGVLLRLAVGGASTRGATAREETASAGVATGSVAASCCASQAGHGLAARAASGYQHRALLRGAGIANLSLPAAAAGHAWLEPRLWQDEVTLCLFSERPLALAELSEMAVRICPLSEQAGGAVSIVQFSSTPLAVFTAVQEECGSAGKETGGDTNGVATIEKTVQSTGIANIASASPAFATVAVQTLADRFALGLAAARCVCSGGGNAVSALAASDALAAEGVSDLCLPQEQIECAVLVVGAGTAGSVAALAAAEEGATVTVLDASPAAGGIGTGGFIFGYFHGQSGGLFERYDQWASEHKAALAPAEGTMLGSRHPDAKKIAFEQRFRASGAGAFIGNAVAYAVEVEDGRVRAVLAVAEGRVYRIVASAVVDATGDADIAALAGAQFEHGRPGDGLPLSYSQSSLRLSDSREGAVVRSTNFDAGWVDATDPEDVTRARVTGIAHYVGEMPCDKNHILQIASVLGLRQSRQIITEQTLTLDDIISHSRFDNAIGSVRSPLDTHSIDFEFESDELLFWLWGCKNFRGMTHSQVPYGVLVPKGLRNVWVACRALGVSTSAAYAVRMIRDMQRMGEAAGVAAAACARLGVDAFTIPHEHWQPALDASGALAECNDADDWQQNVLEQLDSGEPGGYLWTIYQDRSAYQAEVLLRLESANPHVSWLAAVVLAMWGDARAEARLLLAITSREEGVPTPRSAVGAFGQWIDVPNWFLAVSLLRRCGTAAALPVLLDLVRNTTLVFNLRTSVALTVELLAERVGAEHRKTAAEILNVLAAEPVADAFVRPSRSISRALRGEPQQPLPQEPAYADTREDHGWQLSLVLTRAARAWQLPSLTDSSKWLADERALVRRAFATVLAD